MVNTVCQGNDVRIGNALKIKGKTINDSDLVDNKILKYDLASQEWKCEDDVSGGGNGFVPAIGFIGMFSGTWVDNETMLGWYKCDGNNGTVNLVDKFVRGGATSGAMGGSDDAVVITHSHGIRRKSISYQDGVKESNIMNFTGVFFGSYIDSQGGSGVGKNIPAHYVLLFIQRIS